MRRSRAVQRSKVTVWGLEDLERALKQLPRATQRNVLKKVLLRAGKPIADAARANAPVGETGRLRDTITVSTNLANPIGAQEFRRALRNNLGQSGAVKAMRSARRSAASLGLSNFAEAYVGPGPLKYAHLVEWGAAAHEIKPRKKNQSGRLAFSEGGDIVRPGVVQHPGAPPQPFMRPAWDENQMRALNIIRDDLTEVIHAAVVRLAKRRAKRAAKG